MSKEWVTPIGILEYPWLNSPKTLWKAQGEYVTNLLLDESEAQPLIEKINDVIEKHYNKMYNEVKDAVRKKLNKRYPYKKDDETGLIRFNFRSDAVKKDGKVFVLPLVGPDGTPIDREKTLIYSGSEGRIGYRAGPYYMPTIGHAIGCTLYLNAVQVTKIVSYNVAERYGFTPVVLAGDSQEDSVADENDESSQDF